MTEEFFQNIEARIRDSLPFFLTLLLILFDATPKRIPDFTPITPILPVASLYFWVIFRPDLLGTKWAFLLGFLYDMALGTPIGISSALFMGVDLLTRSQRKFFYRKPFLLIWLGFALMMILVITAQWALTSIVLGRILPIEGGIFSGIQTVCAYPLISWAFARFQQALMRRSR